MFFFLYRSKGITGKGLRVSDSSTGPRLPAAAGGQEPPWKRQGVVVVAVVVQDPLRLVQGSS